MVSAMGDADGKARGGFVLLDQNFKVSCRGFGHAADLPHAPHGMFRICFKCLAYSHAWLCTANICSTPAVHCLCMVVQS